VTCLLYGSSFTLFSYIIQYVALKRDLVQIILAIATISCYFPLTLQQTSYCPSLSYLSCYFLQSYLLHPSSPWFSFLASWSLQMRLLQHIRSLLMWSLLLLKLRLYTLASFALRAFYLIFI
jgi:hypothetical protein